MALPKNVYHWSISDVSHWLKESRFEDEIPLFKEHKIDGKSLLLLESNDIAELITTIGPRVKFRAKLSQLFSSRINQNKQQQEIQANYGGNNTPSQPRQQRYNFIQVYPNQAQQMLSQQVRYQPTNIITQQQQQQQQQQQVYSNQQQHNIRQLNYKPQVEYNKSNAIYKNQSNTQHVQPNQGQYNMKEGIHYTLKSIPRDSNQNTNNLVGYNGNEVGYNQRNVDSRNSFSRERVEKNERKDIQSNDRSTENNKNDVIDSDKDDVIITKEVNFKIKSEPIDYEDDQNNENDEAMDERSNFPETEPKALALGSVAEKLPRSDTFQGEEVLSNYQESNTMLEEHENHSINREGENQSTNGSSDDGYESNGNRYRNMLQSNMEVQTNDNHGQIDEEENHQFLSNIVNSKHDSGSVSMVTIRPKYTSYQNEVIDVNEYSSTRPTKNEHKASIELVTNRLALRERSKIFRRSEKKWHVAVNETAYQLVKSNPRLLNNKRELRLLAESEVRKTYRFAKGKSRSIAIPENRAAAEERKKQRLTKDKIGDMKRRLNAEGEELSRKMRQCHMKLTLAAQQTDTTTTRHLREEMQRLNQMQAKLHFRMDDLLYHERKLNGYQAKENNMNQVYYQPGTQDQNLDQHTDQSDGYIVVPEEEFKASPTQLNENTLQTHYNNEQEGVIQLSTESDNNALMTQPIYNGDNSSTNIDMHVGYDGDVNNNDGDYSTEITM